MAIKRYLADAALDGVLEVVELLPGDQPTVRVLETWFHPQGGGQKGDRGTLGAVEVVDVRYGANQAIDHIVSSLDGLKVGARYPFTIDASRRHLNSRLHSAGHLLSGVCEDLYGDVAAAKGHHWPGECRVDFEGLDLDRLSGGRDEIAAAIDRDIAAGTSIAIVGDPWLNRSCRVGQYRPIGCGGTHVASAAELGAFAIRSIKRKGSMVRVGYELGGVTVT